MLRSRYSTIMLNSAPALSPEDLRRRLRPFCEKHKIRRLELFGSAANRQASPSSDVDLLVTLAESASVSTDDLLEMAGEAEELVGRPVADFVLRHSLEIDRIASPASTFWPPPCAYMETDQLGQPARHPWKRPAALIGSLYVKDITAAEFSANKEKQDAVIRRIEIIGEAAALPHRGKPAGPSQNSPFEKCAACATSSSHDYANVDLHDRLGGRNPLYARDLRRAREVLCPPRISRQPIVPPASSTRASRIMRYNAANFRSNPKFFLTPSCLLNHLLRAA